MTQIKFTTHMEKKSGGVESLVANAKRRTGGAWTGSVLGRRRSGGAWVGIYSTPDVSCVDLGASASGASGSGTTTSGAAAPSFSGSYFGLSYSWSLVSGDGSITCSNTASSTPTFSRAFAGVGAASTSTVSAVWQLTITDTSTGAQAYCQITITLSWQNTSSAYGPFTATGGSYSGSAASGTGPARGIVEPWGGTSTPITISGGPTSGSFSYAWSYDSGDNTIAPNSTSIAQPAWSGSFVIPSQTTRTDSAVWNCLITDTVSGNQYTLAATIEFTYTNNTG